jgi:hypothetical protein
MFIPYLRLKEVFLNPVMLFPQTGPHSTQPGCDRRTSLRHVRMVGPQVCALGGRQVCAWGTDDAVALARLHVARFDVLRGGANARLQVARRRRAYDSEPRALACEDEDSTPPKPIDAISSTDIRNIMKCC